MNSLKQKTNLQRWVCLGFWQRKRAAQRRNKQEVLIAIVLGKIKKKKEETAQTSRIVCFVVFFFPASRHPTLYSQFVFFLFVWPSGPACFQSAIRGLAKQPNAVLP